MSEGSLIALGKEICTPEVPFQFHWDIQEQKLRPMHLSTSILASLPASRLAPQGSRRVRWPWDNEA